MLKVNQFKENKDYHELFNIIAGVRIIFLLTSVINFVIELGLSFSILKIADTATSIVIRLLMATILNILLLAFYLRTVREPNNQSNFLIYIVEVLSTVYGLLGIYAYFRLTQEIEVITLTSIIGMIGLIDLILINVFIGSYFLQHKTNDRLVEFAILINLIILISLIFI